MKILISILTLTTTLILMAETASACMQPLPTMVQQTNLSRVLASQNFKTQLAKHATTDRYVTFTSISFGGGVHVSLSNKCVIMSVVNYARPTQPGMCPSFVGVDSESYCPEE